MDHSAETQLRHRKMRDRAMVLLITGVLLLTPPIAGIFLMDSKINGIPVTLIYISAVWAFLILGARLLARRLPAAEAEAPAINRPPHA